EDVSTEAEIEILRNAGHQVQLIEETNNDIKNYSSLDKLELFFSTTWNYRKYREIRAYLQSYQPDLVHVQNFFPLFSPSIHSAAQSLGIPTIQHLRNFRLACLNAYLFREGKVCEACVGKNPWRGVVKRCYKKSLPASLSLWNMITYNRWRGTWLNDVTAFITPSQFAANKFIEVGIPEDRLFVKPNITPDPLTNQKITSTPEQPTFLFFGRLSAEKGLINLFIAWEKLAQPTWKLNIIGDGEQREELEKFVQDRNLHNIHFQGYQTKDKIIDAIKQSTIVVVPSQWHETFGRVVIEAFACGRGVIASNLGALAELVTEGETGFLVEAHNLNAWVDTLRLCGNNPSLMAKIDYKCRQIYLERYTPEVNYEQTIDIYKKVMES
ncbi:glycosyltransferase, partial [Hyella patelloides]